MKDATIRRIYVYYFLAATLGVTSGCGGGTGGDGPAPASFRTSLCSDVLYPDQASSPYILPFQVGEAYLEGRATASRPVRAATL